MAKFGCNIIVILATCMLACCLLVGCSSLTPLEQNQLTCTVCWFHCTAESAENRQYGLLCWGVCLCETIQNGFVQQNLNATAVLPVLLPCGVQCYAQCDVATANHLSISLSVCLSALLMICGYISSTTLKIISWLISRIFHVGIPINAACCTHKH